MTELTAGRLRELLNYDQDTGYFTWAINRLGTNISAGDTAGSLDKKGYAIIKVDGRSFKAHRLAWLYMTGEWPAQQIDHINMNKSDNRWKNLRKATARQNKANSCGYAGSFSGVKGVWKVPRTNKWRACIRVNYRLIHLGYFDTIEAASEAYLAAAVLNFGDFARSA